MSLLNRLYHKYSNTSLVKTFGKIYRNGFFLSNYMAYCRMKKMALKKKEKGKIINVVYLCQYTQAWNKLKSVCDMMINDDRFCVKILAVPENIHKPDEKMYRYFVREYGENVVIDAYKNGEWYDMRSLNPDYVFFQRPYDQYLPKQYRSGQVSKYSRVCHLIYGYLLTETEKDICNSKLFFRNVYMYFAESSVCMDYNVNRFKISHKNGYRKSLNIGYPVLEYFVRQKPERERDGERYRVLWTPRWSEDEEVGGSNFINFKDKIADYFMENKNMELVFRPHPMTFDHFISVGRLTRKEADEYVELYKNSDNMEYDKSAEYSKVFWNTDALVTDISSIIMEYFLTEKPIIYCDTGAVPNEFFAEMLKVMYVVKTWEQVKEKIHELSLGKDPLKKARKEKLNELMGGDLEHIAERFLEAIYDDYNS